MISVDRRDGASHEPSEQSSHYLTLQWAQAVATGSVDPELRGAVIDLYGDMPTALLARFDKKGIRHEAHQYATSRNLNVIAPDLLDITSQLPKDITPDQLELVGFTGFLTHALRIRNAETEHNIILDPAEFISRKVNWGDTGDEDWLTSLAFLVERNGCKKERDMKQAAQDTNLTYIIDLEEKRIKLDDIEYMYEQVARAIYPPIENVVVFRDEALSIDAAVRNLAYGNYLERYTRGENADARRDITGDFLGWYNHMVKHPWYRREMDQANIYMAYLVIHPHIDGNGTMARTLVDYYSFRVGHPQIDWSKLEPDGSFASFLSGDVGGMQRLFEFAPTK